MLDRSYLFYLLVIFDDAIPLFEFVKLPDQFKFDLKNYVGGLLAF
jgi:hypothetical protein